MANRDAAGHMSPAPTRTVEVIPPSAAALMARGSEFRLEGVKGRFHEQLRPVIVTKLRSSPGVKLFRLAAQVVGEVIRLVQLG